MLSTDLKQMRDLLGGLEAGCRSEGLARFRHALDYSREMYTNGLDRYLANVEQIDFIGGRALDVGCGAGHWCLALAQHNDEVVGLDANEEYVSIARFTARNFRNGHRLHLFTGVAERLPYPDNYFDYLVCHGVLMFTEHELALSEFRRVLKPDGQIYLGYSGLGWYLRYLLEDGIVEGNESRLRKGASVLSASFKFAAGFRQAGELWLSLPPTTLNQLVESSGFKITGHPGIQDIKMDGFLGLEAPYDLLAQTVTTDLLTEQVRVSSDEKPAKAIQNLIDIWRPRLALQLLKDSVGKKLDSETAFLLQARAALKMADFETAERILTGLKSDSPLLYFAKAICAHGQKQYMRALTHYESAADLEQRDTVDYLRAECKRESGEREKAATLFRELVARDPGSLRAWVGLICSAASRDRIKANAAEFLESQKSSLVDPAAAEQLLQRLKQSRPAASPTPKTTGRRATNERSGDLKPRRKTRHIDSDDPFMKLVPGDAPSKDGGMRILLLADFNIAGQMTRVMRALNRYTNHAARCVILQDDYLSYDRDLVLHEIGGATNNKVISEAAALVQEADFYHIGRQPFALPGIDWNRLLNQNNTLFQYFGSYLRDNADELRKLHEGRGFAAVTAMEWTMYRALPQGFYHIQPYMLEPDELPQADWSDTSHLRICHAPSGANYRQLKGSDEIIRIMRQLENDNPDVEVDIIENVSNADCLNRKSRCHLHVVALRYGFGLNAIESAALGLVPLVQLPNFVRMAYPDSPVVHINRDSLQDTLRELIDNREHLPQLADSCRAWALREFSAKNLIRKYWYLYDFIYNGLSVDYPQALAAQSPSAVTMRNNSGAL